jgi:hypothetical protein
MENKENLNTAQPQPPEQQPAQPPAPPVEERRPLRVYTPLMEERFQPLVSLYAQKAGLGEDLQAAALQLASLLQEVGMDPWEDPDRLQDLAQAIGSMNTPEAGRLADELLSRAGERLVERNEMAQAIKEMKPLLAQAQAMRLIERIMAGGGNSGSSPELQQIASRLEALERRLEEKEKFEPLRQEIQALHKRLEEVTSQQTKQLPPEVQQVITGISETMKALEQKLSADPFKTVESVLGIVDKISEKVPKGGATQADIELAKLKADLERQLEKDRKDWELELEKMRQAREQLQALSRLGDTAITHVASPLAQAFASGYTQAKQGKQVDLSKLSTEDLERMRRQAEQVLQRYAEARRQVEEELAKRKPPAPPPQEKPPEVKVEQRAEAGNNPVPNPPPSG